MADELQLEPVEKGGSKKKLVIIIVAAVVLLLIIGGGAAWFLMSGDKDKAADGAKTEQTDGKDGEKGAAPKPGEEALYVALPNPFTFNVPGNRGSRVVQINAQVMVRGATDEDLAKKNLPLIESVLLQTFSQFTEEQLATSQGRESLRTTSQEAVRDALTKVAGKPVVERVLITGFVMQ